MKYDVIIIGGGQAGLSMGFFLKSTNLTFLILDKSSELGDVWRNRYDSLTLFTPRNFSSLPGMNMSGNPAIYPTKDEVADYLLSYAKRFSLPVQKDTTVSELSRLNDAFKIVTNRGELTARNVVVATGPFQDPFVPEFSAALSNSVLQIHSADYKNTSQLNDGSVLVVGGGNSGAQIAVELSKDREVCLSVGHKMKFLPQDIGRKSIFWYFDKLGIYKAGPNSKVGQFIKNQPDPIFGMELKKLVKAGKVKLKPKTVSVENDTFTFQDDTELQIKNVVWSTGFRLNYSWMNISNVLDENGLPMHERGVTTTKGLYFLGLPWQSSRGSALIQGVGADAQYLLQHIVKAANKKEADRVPV